MKTKRIREFKEDGKMRVLQGNFERFQNEDDQLLTAEDYSELGYIQEGLKAKGVNLDSPIAKMGSTPDHIALSFRSAMDYVNSTRSQKIDILTADDKSIRKFSRKMSDVLGGSLTNDQIVSGISAYKDYKSHMAEKNDELMYVKNNGTREQEILYVSEYIDKHISIMDRIKGFRSEVVQHFNNFGRNQENEFTLKDSLIDTVGTFGLPLTGAVKIMGGKSGEMKMNDKVDQVSDAVKGHFDNVIASKDLLVEQFQKKQEEFEEKMALLKEKTINFFPSLANAFKQKIMEVANAIKENVTTGIDAVVEAKDKTVEVAVNMKNKAVENVTAGIDAVVEAKDKTVEVAVNMKNKAVENVNAGVDAVVAVKDKAIDGVSNSVLAAKESTTEMVADGKASVKTFFTGDKEKNLAAMREMLAQRDLELKSSNKNSLRA